MADSDLRKGDSEFVLALASGQTARDAAKAAGISERTAYRRLGNDEFRRRVGHVRNELMGRAVGRLADASVAAVETLKSLLDAESENVRLGAAKAILDQAGRYTGHAQAADEPVFPVQDDGLHTFRFDPQQLSPGEAVTMLNIMDRCEANSNGSSSADDDEPWFWDSCDQPADEKLTP